MQSIVFYLAVDIFIVLAITKQKTCNESVPRTISEWMSACTKGNSTIRRKLCTIKTKNKNISQLRVTVSDSQGKFISRINHKRC